MPATKYKVWAWGAPVGVGVTGATFVGIAGVAKKATPQEPHIIANEVVCNAIARMLVLPCPPGATLDRNGEPWFFSLDFNLAGQALPPADPATIVAQHPRLSWGVILFDSFVLNQDRHPGNIAYDAATGRVQIFDHSHAFLRTRGDVSQILAQSDGQLCIGGHCLAAQINDFDGMDMWIERIRQIPDFFIEEVVHSATTVGLPIDNKKECIDFLKKRRTELGEVVRRNLGSFPRLPRI